MREIADMSVSLYGKRAFEKVKPIFSSIGDYKNR